MTVRQAMQEELSAGPVHHQPSGATHMFVVLAPQLPATALLCACSGLLEAANLRDHVSGFAQYTICWHATVSQL